MKMGKKKRRKLDVPKRVPRVIPTKAEADAKRDEGMDASEGNSGEEWAEYAHEFIVKHLRVHEELFSDNLWIHGLEMPKSPRALGSRFTTIARLGLMESTGTYRNSVSSNNSARVLWRSLSYEGEAHCAHG
jgi:hypothetical protein